MYISYKISLNISCNERSHTFFSVNNRFPIYPYSQFIVSPNQSV